MKSFKVDVLGATGTGGSLGPNLIALDALDATPGILEQTGPATFVKRPVAGPTSLVTQSELETAILAAGIH